MTKVHNSLEFVGGAKISGLPVSTADGEVVVHQQLAGLGGGAVTDAGLAADVFTPANVASAATCDIGAATTTRITITGTTTITSFGTGADRLRFVTFAGALTLTHNGTSLILPGGANITTAAGDTATFASDSSGNWRCLSYNLASGKAVVAPAQADISGLVSALAGKASTGANTFSDAQTIQAANAVIALNKAASGGVNRLQGNTNGSQRWLLDLGNDAAESGSNAGSNFAVHRYADNGSYLGLVLEIVRSTGAMNLGGSPVLTAATVGAYAGKWQLIQSTTASAQANVETVFGAGQYSQIKIVAMDVVRASAGTIPVFTLRHSGGAIMTVNPAYITNSAGEAEIFEVTFSLSPATGATNKRYSAEFPFLSAAGELVRGMTFSALTTSVADRVRFNFSSGNITSGKVNVYGLLGS